MLPLATKKLLGAVLAAAALSGAVPASAAGVSIRSFGAMQMRLASIGYRIASANARTCRSPEMMTGMILHDLTQYDAAARPAISGAFSLDTGFGILQIVPGSAADRAGLQIDDEIIAVGGKSVSDPIAGARRGKSSTRVRAFADSLSAALRNGSAELLIRRAGRPYAIKIVGEAGCGGEVLLANSSDLNAWSDGRHVVVTTAMSQMAANEDELAFVIAHEMAHNSLGHAGAGGEGTRGLFGLFRLGGGNRQMEVDADSYAVPLMAAGGYKPQAGISFLRSANRRLWWSVSIDHPGCGRRMKIVEAAIAQLAASNGPRMGR